MAHIVLVSLFFIPFVAFVGWLVVVGIGILRSEKREREAPTTYHPNRAYLSWRPRDGWPRGPYLWYECTLCGQSLGSQQRRPQECGCGNLFVGPEQIGAKDEARVKLYEERIENNPHPENRPFNAG